MRAAASGSMSFSMLHCSRKVARKNRRMRSAAGMRLSNSGDMSVSLSCASFERHIRFLQPIRDCAVGTHHVGYAVGQDQLQPVDGGHSEQRIALIDQVENGSNDERDIERPAGHAVGNRTPACELPDRIRTTQKLHRKPPHPPGAQDANGSSFDDLVGAAYSGTRDAW